MDTKFCSDCGLVVTNTDGMEIFGRLIHRACVLRKALKIIGEILCAHDDEVRAAVRRVHNDWDRFVELLCLVANKLAVNAAAPATPEQQCFLDVLFQKFVMPRFDAAQVEFPQEQAEDFREQLFA